MGRVSLGALLVGVGLVRRWAAAAVRFRMPDSQVRCGSWFGQLETVRSRSGWRVAQRRSGPTNGRCPNRIGSRSKTRPVIGGTAQRSQSRYSVLSPLAPAPTDSGSRVRRDTWSKLSARHLKIEYGGATGLRFSTPIGRDCEHWKDLGAVTLSDAQEMLMRVGLRTDDDCVALQLDLRQLESGRGDWRTLPAGMICDLDLDRARVWRAGSLLAIPYHSQGGLLEARPLGSGVSAAVDGEILPNDCGWVMLLYGYRSVWQVVRNRGECDSKEYQLAWVLRIAQPREPDDPEDRQQLHVYDWEWELEANVLPEEWFKPITGLHAERIVRAVYADFLGDSAMPPDVRRAHPDAEYAGSYDAESHTIFLAPKAMNVALVLHETAHALLRLSAELDEATRYYLAPRHGPAFTARLIQLWIRYSEGLDVEAIRAAAERHERVSWRRRRSSGRVAERRSVRR